MYLSLTPQLIGISLEIYFKDSRSLLVVFTGKDKRHTMGDKLSSMIQGERERYGDTLAPGGGSGLLRSPVVSLLSARVSGRTSARAAMGFRADELMTAQRRWQAREISNVRVIVLLLLLYLINPIVHLHQHSQSSVGTYT